MASPDSDYPKDPNLQLLVGVIFAESGSKNYGGGENASEKEAIGKTFVNAAYYAAMKEQGGKKCYNDSFGDGTILSAIQTMAVAYSTAIWNRVMNGNLRSAFAPLRHHGPEARATASVPGLTLIGWHPSIRTLSRSSTKPATTPWAREPWSHASRVGSLAVRYDGAQARFLFPGPSEESRT